jgi:hypothetical protein
MKTNRVLLIDAEVNISNSIRLDLAGRSAAKMLILNTLIGFPVQLGLGKDSTIP